MAKIDLNCLMCNRPFVTLDEGFRLCCSVGCSIDWAQGLPAFNEENLNDKDDGTVTGEERKNR